MLLKIDSLHTIKSFWKGSALKLYLTSTQTFTPIEGMQMKDINIYKKQRIMTLVLLVERRKRLLDENEEIKRKCHIYRRLRDCNIRWENIDDGCSYDVWIDGVRSLSVCRITTLSSAWRTWSKNTSPFVVYAIFFRSRYKI